MNKLASVQLGDGEEGVVEERKEGSRSLVQAGAILENHIYISENGKRTRVVERRFFCVAFSPRSPVFLIVLHIFRGIIARVPVVPPACLISGDSCRSGGERSFNSNLEINLGNGSAGVLILWGENILSAIFD